jgi:hypothetical protein
MKAIIAKLLEFLKSNTGHSSLRLMAVGSVITCCISILTVVISEAFNVKADWVGAAVVVTAIGAIITAVIFGKNHSQKIDKQ